MGVGGLAFYMKAGLWAKKDKDEDEAERSHRTWPWLLFSSRKEGRKRSSRRVEGGTDGQRGQGTEGRGEVS